VTETKQCFVSFVAKYGLFQIFGKLNYTIGQVLKRK